MNFRPELAAKVMAGEKTVTRRLVSDNPRSTWAADGCKLVEGFSYAVCPGRGKPAICRVIVQRVDGQRLGQLSHEEARREGFASPAEFEVAFAAINGGSYKPTARVWRVQFVRQFPGTERCARCSDDGWVELFDDDDNPTGAQDCPYLGEAWHRPFNYSGVLPA